MTGERSIVINGDLGSGKSTVARELASRLGVRRVAMGDVHRQMAQAMKLTTLELNQRAEADEAIDDHVDQVQKDLASSGERLVVDSRLGWHFFPDAFKTYLIVDPRVAAERVVVRPADAVEGYSSLEEAEERLQSRSHSERARFIARYGVDKYRLRNYDLVCDTTSASATEVTDIVVDAVTGVLAPRIVHDTPPLLLLDPARLFPTREATPEDSSAAVQAIVPGTPGAVRDAVRRFEPLGIGHAGRHFYVLEGHRRLSSALRAGLPIVPGRLVAERDEIAADDLTAVEYFRSHVTAEIVAAWEAVHGTRLAVPAHLRGE
ncbi:MAG TPA: AAA family ATPase [Actinopolymorphaceae bacterium]